MHVVSRQKLHNKNFKLDWIVSGIQIRTFMDFIDYFVNIISRSNFAIKINICVVD